MLKAGVHRLRVSSWYSGPSIFFGVLAEPYPNGEILEAASFAPTGSTVRTRRNQAAINTVQPAQTSSTTRVAPAAGSTWAPRNMRGIVPRLVDPPRRPMSVS